MRDSISSAAFTPPLFLLIRVNTLTLWRRLTAIGEQSAC